MVFKRFVEVGRVVLINYGPQEGKLAVIVNVLDANRVQIDGPASNVKRQVINNKRLSLTDITIPIRFNAKRNNVIKAWNEADVEGNWQKTSWAKKRAAKARRANLTDFDRFKLYKARQTRSALLKEETNRLIAANEKA
mmetsp:Transcript_3525/g.9560  ORF Transcript_3525/g.9560 Transcript_3525/m.9560 type:complete len:138 (-) Transcript_3525:33-446(-)|eukprot:CAMPEP_0119130584 /NCGR_PEP_ID=MMETSP1310-20130426/7863_1 /TAXON_ID=464262 /ORGANISM="Genus nov. species nov., Strain RCC2339" /LENGTH=137 /DNA_ID=CAMNT_0007121107 /DNA_START=104 /DNA_END=517 /DNA_ORIENTATION=+